MKVKLVNTLKVPHPRNPDKDIVLRGGQVHELDDEIAQRALDLGSAVRVEGDAEESEQESGVDPEDVVLPERPGNGGTKEAWLTYTNELAKVTEELGPLNVPPDAKRDDLIALADTRRADWDAYVADEDDED